MIKLTILVVINNLDKLDNYSKWVDVEEVILVNVGQPEFGKLRKGINDIVRRHIFEDQKDVIIFPPFDMNRVTDELLYGVGILYGDDVEVIN